MKVFRIVKVLFFLSLLAGGCIIQRNTLPKVELEIIAEGFTSPVALVSSNDGTGRLFVVDQVGMVWILSEGKNLENPFLDLRSQLVELNSFYDERGLLGLAFHPDFGSNGRFYVSYSAPLPAGLSPDVWDHTTYISEFTISADDANRADPTSERVLMALPKFGYNYEAGHIAFGPDGYLYISTGDSVRNPTSQAGKYAQDTFSFLGKILRIDVNGTGPPVRNYLIPRDNPLTGGAGIAEVYAYGFRNPYRFSFDSAGGETRLFVVDVGQAIMEEVNMIEAGGNYGWPIREGITCFNPQAWSQPLKNCSTDKLMDPIIAYAHEGDLSAIIGGVVYRGESLPFLYGGYVFGDWGRGNGHLFVAFSPESGTGLWSITEIKVELPGSQSGIGQLLGIGADEQGELYLLTKDPGVGPVGESGRIYKLIPP